MAALVVLGVESFYTDLAAQYDTGTPPMEELEALGEEYSRLTDELDLVLSEQMSEFRNPMPSLRRGFRYSESTKLPGWTTTCTRGTCSSVGSSIPRPRC